MTENLPDKPSNSEILFYQTEGGSSRIQVRLENNTVWLSQAQMSELYQTSIPNVNVHIKNIYAEIELRPEATIKEYLIVRTEGSRTIKRRVKFYNLDMVLAVGYRVKSNRGTQFRRWATERLREYLIKGFVLDDARLKNPKDFGDDHFDELLERIRDIRASEKRFYHKVCDIYALAEDYDAKAEQTHEFFQIVQNKMHWAITGHTAAELIKERADADKPHMGLNTWEGAKIHSKDVTIAKNYLTEDELKQLNKIVTMYLDYAEEQAKRHQAMYMRDWRDKLDAFLQFNGREVLKDAGHISMKIAQKLALAEYDKFHTAQLHQEAVDAEAELENEVKQLGYKPDKSDKKQHG